MEVYLPWGGGMVGGYKAIGGIGIVESFGKDEMKSPSAIAT